MLYSRLVSSMPLFSSLTSIRTFSKDTGGRDVETKAPQPPRTRGTHATHLLQLSPHNAARCRRGRPVRISPSPRWRCSVRELACGLLTWYQGAGRKQKDLKNFDGEGGKKQTKKAPYQVQTLQLEAVNCSSFTAVHVVTKGQDNLERDHKYEEGRKEELFKNTCLISQRCFSYLEDFL